MPYLLTSRTHEPSHTPPPDSQPIRFSLLPTLGIYTLYILIVASPAILIAVEGLPEYQTDLTCQLLVQLLHLIALAQIQHFRTCPNNLPNNVGLPLHTTLSLLIRPILELLHNNSFHRPWRSSPARSSTQHSIRSTSPSPEPSSNTTTDKPGSIPPLPPFPWPFKSHHIPPHLLPPQ